jgi:hypothetical protein
MEAGWKEVYVTDLEYQAFIARDILESSGLRVVVMNQKDSTYLVFGNLVVLVPEEDAETAAELLKDLKH